MNHPIKTLLLDLDGTLVDSREDLASSVNFVLESLGYPKQTTEEIVPRIGNGLRRLLSDTLGITDPKILLEAKQVFEDHYGANCLDQTKLYPHIEDCLKEFSEDLKLGVVTNKPKIFADKVLDGLGILSLMDTVIGGDSLPESKPHPAPVLEAMKHLGAGSGSTLIVGDGHQDILAGQAAGIGTCLVRYGFGFKPELIDLKPTHVIGNFKELKEIVK